MKKRKIISLICALILCLSLLPVPASAVEMITFTVTFKVVNGQWDDGTTADKVVQLSRRADEDLLLVLVNDDDPAHPRHDIPAVGSKPDPEHTTGSWNVIPSYDRAVSRDATYIYTYTKMDDRKISLDKSIIEDGDRVWFGTQGGAPILWRVLSALGVTTYDGVDLSDTSGTDEMLLISNYLQGSFVYSNSITNNPDDNNALAWCASLYANWPESVEKTSIRATEISESYDYNNAYPHTSPAVAPPAGADGNFFFLSVKEAELYLYPASIRVAYGSANDESNQYGEDWWLRSIPIDGTQATYVANDGTVGEEYVTNSGGARPAFNLDPASVLFVSDPDGGKTSTAGALAAIPASLTSEWKLTLHDAARDGFAVTGTTAEVELGSQLRIKYSGAATGANEYVSVLLCNSDETAVLAYGSSEALTAANKAGGTLYFDLPSDIKGGPYKLKVFSEQKNGAAGNDYASAFRTLTLNVTLPKEPKPNATFKPTGFETGILNGVSDGMKYKINKGNWQTISTSGTSITLDGLSQYLDDFLGCTITVYKPGNGTSTSDSSDCVCYVYRDWTPNLKPTQPSTIGGTGSIPTTTAHEFSLDNVNWSTCGGITADLVPGTYYVRAAAGFYLASDAQEIVINEFIPSPEPTPAAIYKPTALRKGTLSNLADGGHYTVTGAAIADFTLNGATSYALDDVSPGAIFYIIKKGNETTTIDSGVQELTASPYLGMDSGSGTVTVPKETRFDTVDTGKGGTTENFKAVKTYKEGMFGDVDAEDWFAENIEAAVEYGLMEGMGDSSYGVGEPLKVSEALAITCRLHNIYYGGSGKFDQTQDKTWYQVYEDYAAQYGILAKGLLDMNAPATRAQFAAIVSAALPDEALAPISGKLPPDVPESDPYYPAIARLYAAGILSGVDEQGTFLPDAAIPREQIAAIATRAAVPALRVSDLSEEGLTDAEKGRNING